MERFDVSSIKINHLAFKLSKSGFLTVACLLLFIYRSIKARNSVIFVRPRNDGFDAEDIMPILKDRFYF